MSNDNFDALFDAAAGLTASKWEADPNQFRPSITQKKDGKKVTVDYQALLAFVPPLEGPLFVKKRFHYFQEQAPGMTKPYTFNETCRWVLGRDEKCPVCDSNIADHKSGDPALKARAKNRNNRDKYLVNVLVIKDIINPENNGKVLWWEMPLYVFNMIEAKRNPPPNPAAAFSDEPVAAVEPVNVFHPIKGVNFVLTMKENPEGNSKLYVASQFLSKARSEAEVQAIVDARARCHDLEKILKSSVKSYDEMTKAFLKVTAPGATSKTFASLDSIAGAQTPALEASYTGTLRGNVSIPKPDAALDAEFDRRFDMASGAAPSPVGAPAAPSAPAQAQSHGAADPDDVEDWLKN